VAASSRAAFTVGALPGGLVRAEVMDRVRRCPLSTSERLMGPTLMMAPTCSLSGCGDSVLS
jgi:hypothetical protein